MPQAAQQKLFTLATALDLDPDTPVYLCAKLRHPEAMLTPQDPDSALRAKYRRYRVFASSLLVIMAGLAAGSYWLPPSSWTSLLHDAAKAGLIGGVADWFAVTALFRHPLGLPIPHTAILPAQKQRLGDAMGRFIANHVFTEADIRRLLGDLDISAFLQQILTDRAITTPLAESLAGMLPKLLSSLEDGRARRLLNRLLPKLISGQAGGIIIARALSGLVEGGKHQEVFSFMLSQIKQTLAEREDTLRETVKERVTEHGGKLVGWAVGAGIAKRVLLAVNQELDKIGPDSSEVRDAFDEWVRAEIKRLETDPARATELGQSFKEVLRNETVRAWIWDVWARVRHALELDAANPHGRTVAVIEAALGNLAEALAQDQKARQRLNNAAQDAILHLLPKAQQEGARFIGHVIGAWDAKTITNKLELRVGKDLQYIRINGTLVGFFLGAALNLIGRLVPLHL